MDSILTNFESPEKADMEKFMENHFMFNLPLKAFCYITRRSLSTFNRDFRRTFNATPRNWLTKKRLELAHHQISEHVKKPADVYMEVGFEDLSNFALALEKYFGYVPTTLLNQADH